MNDAIDMNEYNETIMKCHFYELSMILQLKRFQLKQEAPG